MGSDWVGDEDWGKAVEQLGEMCQIMGTQGQSQKSISRPSLQSLALHMEPTRPILNLSFTSYSKASEPSTGQFKSAQVSF